MKKYKLLFLKEAYNDLDTIFDYIALDSPSSANAILDKIFKALSPLETFPLSGTKTIHSSLKNYEFRMIIVHPYIIFYRVIDDIVYIYRILHGARDYIDILKP